MGQRERERRRRADPASERMARGYERGRERDEQARAALVPLAPGERPGAVTVAAVVALVLAAANVLALAIDRALAENAVFLSIAFSVILLVCAAGLWLVKYWAVLGFQALLCIQMILFSGSLLLANDVWQVVVSLTAVLLGGWLFWKLVKAMARIQMPAR
jgi:energy-coupling factor transporter transmembrane protein EcfT